MEKRQKGRLGKTSEGLEDLGIPTDDLSERERRFVYGYLAGPPAIRGRALPAARAAGLSRRDTGAGSKLLARPNVRAAIDRYHAQQGITRDRVLAELGHLAFSDMRDFISWGEDGLDLKDSESLPDAAAACVAEVSEGSGTVRFRLHDKLGALVSLGKNLGLFKDRVVHTGKGGGPLEHRHTLDLSRLTDEELETLRQLHMKARPPQLALVAGKREAPPVDRPDGPDRA